MGGITGMCLVRDICVAAGKFITCDDAWRSDLSVAATTHVATATPASMFFATDVSTDFSLMEYDSKASKFDDGFIEARSSRASASTRTSRCSARPCWICPDEG